LDFSQIDFSSRPAVHRSLYLIFGSLLLILIPFNLKWASGALILFSFNWLIEGSLKEKFKRLKSRPFYILFSFLYLIYLVSILWSENKDAAWFDMEIKLSLFWMPIIFGSMSDELINLFNKKRTLTLFSISCALAGLFCIIHSYITYLGNGNIEEMYYGFFSHFMHTTFFSYYLCFSLVICVYYLIRDWKISLFAEKVLYTFISLISIVTIYFGSSRAGYLLLILTLMLLGVMMIRASLLPKSLILPAVLGLLAFTTAIWFTPEIKKRINSITEEFSHFAVRIPIWKISIQKISEKPLLGYGNGDVTDTLVEEYKRYGYDNIVEDRYNSHNQFLQTMLAAGVLALLILFLMVILPFIRAVKNSEVIYACFLLIIIVGFMIDTTLKVQAGVIFYAVFNALCFRYTELSSS